MADPARTRKIPLLIVATVLVVSLATSLAPLASLEHTVAPGDALSSIATTYDVTVDQLVTTNGISDPNLIIAGFTLTIPDATEASAAVASTAGTSSTHTVVQGDSLWSLAARYHVGLGALARLNGVGSDGIIFVGQVLDLPTSTSNEPTPRVDTETSAGPAPTPQLRTQHSVRDGDTLWGIANRYSVSLTELLEANGLGRDSIINIGQDLQLPQNLVIQTEGLPSSLSEDPVRLQLMPVFDYWANEYSVPADLLKALAWFESGWNNQKRSSAEAIGIGQLLPITATFVSETLIGEPLDPYVAGENIQMSARYLRYLLDHTGDVRLAVASYYQGLSATRQHGIYNSSRFYVDGIVALRNSF